MTWWIRQTRCEAASALKREGAASVIAYSTHAVLSGNVERVQTSDLDKLVVTDTIPLREDASKCNRIHQLRGQPAG